MRPDDLYRSPNALAPEYARFRVASRLLLTGHSHQAWPDSSLAGQVRAWEDAAEAVDAKWERAFAMAERVRRGFAAMLADEEGDYALGANTHELVVRFLSALPLRRRPRLVTTDGEFHTLRRQLDRLSEEGIEVVKVPARPAAGIAEALARAVDDRTAAVLVSAVLFGSGAIVPRLDHAARAAERAGAAFLVDVYHAANVVPYPLARLGLAGAFAVGGGYKYCQMGEGNCFLRAPRGTELRPVVTGWFAEFDDLAAPPGGGVGYPAGAARWAGATYDPTSHYRAAAVLDFFAEQGLEVGLLREVSQHQVGLLVDLFDALDLPQSLISRDRTLPLAETGGFLALTSPRAGELCRRLAERGVATDHRGDVLRLGPAPYLADDQLRAAMGILGEVARGLST